MADSKDKPSTGDEGAKAQAEVPISGPAPVQPTQKLSRVADMSMEDFTSLLRTEVGRNVSEILGRGGVSPVGVHVNSGPPGFVNGGGHANFDPRISGAHVNSGPPGFVNGGGHANFDPRTSGSHVNSGPPGFVNGGGHANFDPKTSGSHVNSGPPGFVNGGGHANFDPSTSLPGRLGQDVTAVTLANGTKVRLPLQGAVDMTVGGVRIKR